MTDLQIGFVAEDPHTATGYYRATLPAKHLHQRFGVPTWVAPYVTQKPRGPLWGLDGNGGMFEAHVIVLRTWTDPPMDKMIREARTNGQVVLFDIDDDVWALPDDNPAKALLGTEGNASLRAIEKNMAACDGVLVSSEGVAAAVREHTDTPVHLCVAGVEAGVPLEFHPIRPRVAWLGSLGYRARDFDLIYKVVRECHDAFDFWWLGAADLAECREFHERYPGILDAVLPWGSVQDLPWALAHVDVVVIPAVDDRFNRARSANTALAALAAGCTVVASPLPATDGLPIFGASGPGAWAEGILHAVATHPIEAGGLPMDYHADVACGQWWDVIQKVTAGAAAL